METFSKVFDLVNLSILLSIVCRYAFMALNICGFATVVILANRMFLKVVMNHLET